MSVITDIEKELTFLIKLQEERIARYEKQIKQFPPGNEATHQIEVYRERALESIGILKALFEEVREIQSHFSPKHLSPKIYSQYECLLKEVRQGLIHCKNDMSNLVKVSNIIAGLRNSLPKAIAESHAQMPA